MEHRLRIVVLVLVLALAASAASFAGPGAPDRCGACANALYGLNSLWQYCPVCGKPLDPQLRSTVAIRTLATCAEAYAGDHHAAPASPDVAGLQASFQPAYVKVMPQKDGWGRDLAYGVDPSRSHYVFGSAGANGVFERRPEDYLIGTSGVPVSIPEGSDDLILVDGSFAAASTENGAKGKIEARAAGAR